MKFGVAFSGVCGIASVGVLEALEEMEMRPEALFLTGNSILPVFLWDSGREKKRIFELCRRLRRKRALRSICLELDRLTPRTKLYLPGKTSDYTTDKSFFPEAPTLRDIREAVPEMIEGYRAPKDQTENQPQTWPLTGMGCERILLVSPGCCEVRDKCDFQLRLPAYDRAAMEDLRLSHSQGYRAALSMREKLYERLLF